jgi:putative salt-induced outer membrane protein YdiY
VRYDPHIANSTDVSTGFSRIIDISEERDFTIDVGWGVHNNYCETQHPATYAQPFVVGNTLMPNTVWEGISNGFLTVTVLNDLTVPNSEVNNDIAINVYISTGEDIEFQGPNDEYLDAFVFHAPPDPFFNI